jgi:hypothetical protein
MQSRSHPRSVSHTQIPHLEVEDKLVSVGPLALTLRQAGILLLGSCVAFNIWKATRDLATLGTVGMVIRVLLVALPILICLAFAFGRIAGRSYEAWLLIIWRYLRQPKVYVWQHLSLTIPVLSGHDDTSRPSQSLESEV